MPSGFAASTAQRTSVPWVLAVGVNVSAFLFGDRGLAVLALHTDHRAMVANLQRTGGHHKRNFLAWLQRWNRIQRYSLVLNLIPNAPLNFERLDGWREIDFSLYVFGGDITLVDNPYSEICIGPDFDCVGGIFDIEIQFR